ncbi:hypothetical protein MBLNU230_g5113t1 [Neophaeotheca triangularis]
MASLSRNLLNASSTLPRISSTYIKTATSRLPSRTFSSTTTSLARTAIVTGASRGIGKAIALRLARDGYDVCINDVEANKSGVDEVVKEIKSHGRNSCAAIADVSNLQQVQQMVQTSVDELGPLNTMIANAGIAQVKPLLDLTEQDFERIFRVNVFGVQNCFSTAAKQIIEQKNSTPEAPSKLIAAASIVAFKPFALLSHYSSTKWAVRGLVQAYAMEMARHHITCNAYAPGIVGTAMWDLIDEELGKTTNRAKGETIRKYTDELIALGRTSVPEDVAKTVGWLAGPDSGYVTGQTQVVDGGIIFT